MKREFRRKLIPEAPEREMPAAAPRKRLLSLLLAALTMLALTGCSAISSVLPDVLPAAAEETEAEGPEVYYLNDTDTGLLTAKSDTANTGEEAIRDLFNTLKSGEFADGHTALPENLELTRTAWQENGVVLYLTGPYPAPGTPEETFCRAALTLTVLSAAEVDSVVINVNNQPLTDEEGREVGPIRRDDFILSVRDRTTAGQRMVLTLYFANAEGTALVKEEAVAELEEGAQMEAAVMELLAGGPKESGHLPVIPTGASVLGVSVRDRICYVNMNEAFRDPVTDIPDELVIFAIVNSLTELDGIDKVQITVNGSADITYDGGLSISLPLSANYNVTEE